MEKRLKEFQEEFKALKIEPKEFRFIFSDKPEEKRVRYCITGLDGNQGLQFFIEKEDEIETLSDILRKKIFVFNDFLGIKYDNTIEVLLTTISFRTSIRNFDSDDDDNFKVIDIGLNYHKNDLNISLEVGESEKILPKITNFIKGGGRYSRRRPIVLKIDNYTKPTSEGIENDTRNIINSVLFDIEFNYGLAFETINIEGLLRRSIQRRKKYHELPKTKINLIFKKYIPELIQYFHIAEKVDFIPFKFICYYHYY